MSRTVRTVAVSESEPAGTECMMTRGSCVRAAAISAADERAALSEVDSVITQHAPTLNQVVQKSTPHAMYTYTVLAKRSMMAQRRRKDARNGNSYRKNNLKKQPTYKISNKS